jgi:hypothetical protein
MTRIMRMCFEESSRLVRRSSPMADEVGKAGSFVFPLLAKERDKG